MRSNRLTTLVVALIAATAIAACGDDDDSATNAGSTSAASAQAACPDGGIRFGVEPYEDPAKLTPAYEVLAGALQKHLDCPVKLQIVESYSAEVLAMRNDQLDVAQFGPLGFVFASQRAGAEPLVSFGTEGGDLSSYKAGIWVPKDSPITDIAGLKGKSVALSEPGSTSGDAMPRYALRTAGLRESDVKVDYTGGHPEALLALTHGKVDAAEVNTQQLATAKSEGEFDEAKYRRIWESEPIPNDPITVRGSLSPALKTKVKEALTELAPADVAKVGAFLDVDPPGPMVEVTKQTYQPLFDLASTLGLTEKDV